MSEVLLKIKDLCVSFDTDDGVVNAVDGVSYELRKGQSVAVVGESGCGKSVTSLSIMRLIPSPPSKVLGGEILLNGENLLEFSEKKMHSIRGNDIAMIFQEPMTSLNPVYTVGDQIVEAVERHQLLKGEAAWAKAVDMLKLVGIADPDIRVNEYPHQLSGGMRQRVMIAMALSCDPKLLIADEPTTALDVTIQAQILELLRDIQKRNNMSILLITHDLGVVAENADYVVVMYASKIIERAPVEALFAAPAHPYTKGLLASLPVLGSDKERLETIEGSVPDPLNFPSGCKFHPRCSIGCKDKKCQTQEPPLIENGYARAVACWHARL